MWRIYYENDIPDSVDGVINDDSTVSDDHSNAELIEAINSLTESLDQQHLDYEEQKEIQAQKEAEEEIQTEEVEETVTDDFEIEAQKQAELEAQEQKELELQEWRDNITSELSDLKAGLSMFMMLYLIFAIWKHISTWRMKATGRL